MGTSTMERRETSAKVLTEKLFPIIACMDEGMGEFEFQGKTGYASIRVSGSGILLGGWSKVVDEAVEFVNSLRAKGINPIAIADHEDCGAAGVVAKNIEYDGDSDELLEKYAREVAEFTGIEHISIPLDRPLGHHTARCVYYTNTPFHPYAVDGEPMENGFVISRFALDTRPALNDLEMTIKIATGPHGEQFSEEDPLRIVIVGMDDDDIDILDSEIDSVIEKSRQEFGEILRVERLIVK